MREEEDVAADCFTAGTGWLTVVGFEFERDERNRQESNVTRMMMRDAGKIDRIVKDRDFFDLPPTFPPR